MRLSLAALALLSLTSCSVPTFDGNEYMTVVEIRQQATYGLNHCAANANSAINVYGQKTLESADKFKSYSQFRRHDENVYKMASALDEMITGLVNSTSGNKIVSLIYCQDKFGNIMESSTRIMQALVMEEK